MSIANKHIRNPSTKERLHAPFHYQHSDTVCPHSGGNIRMGRNQGSGKPHAQSA